MKFQNNCKIELLATDQTRIAISEPYLSGDKLIATNGRSLVALPVEREESDTDGYISGKALAMARKLAKRDAAQIKAKGCLTQKDGTTMPRDDMGGCTYPNWQQCVPKNPAETHTHVFSFNAKALWEVAQAMGTEVVIVRFQDAHSPIVINGSKSPEGALGVLMPARLVS